MISVPKYFLSWLFRANGQLQRSLPPLPRIFENVEIAPFKGGARAAVSISADFELAWAWRNLTEAGMEQRGKIERENVPLILAMLSRHRIPVTWATVGHLFLESCSCGAKGNAHPEMLRPANNFGWEGDWYKHDPCTSLADAPSWYCPDLIRLIQQCDVAQEIATHSFSHIDFGAGQSSTELVRQEIEACIEVMKPFGAFPRSLVYCFNHMGDHHLPLLASLGLTSVRQRSAMRVGYPERTSSGVYKIFESMNLRESRWYDYLDKAKIFLAEAQKHHGAFHIWFHPSDPWTVFDRVFDPILEHIAKIRDEGSVWVATMQDLAAYCEARTTTDLMVVRADNGTSITLRNSIDMRRFGAPPITLKVPVPRQPSAIVIVQNGIRTALSSSLFKVGSGTVTFDVSCRAEKIEVTY